MKTLLLSLFMLPLLVMGQSNEPFRKANTIIIETGLSPEEAYSKWGRHLAQSGYAIGESNKEFLTLSTNPKDTSKWNYDFVLNSSIDENGKVVVQIKRRQKSSVIANTRASEFFDWHYQGKSDVFFNDVYPVVASFGEYPVSYIEK
jgi:hypothetical protein